MKIKERNQITWHFPGDGRYYTILATRKGGRGLIYTVVSSDNIAAGHNDARFDVDGKSFVEGGYIKSGGTRSKKIKIK